MKLQSIIASYELDIKDLEQSIKEYGTTPAANRTLKRLKAKLKELKQQSVSR